MHFSATPSEPSQLSSWYSGSIGSVCPFFVHVYSQPHGPVSGLPSMSHGWGGRPPPRPGASLPPPSLTVPPPSSPTPDPSWPLPPPPPSKPPPPPPSPFPLGSTVASAPWPPDAHPAHTGNV